jgi:ribose 5-phosphate isomerase B
VNVDVAKPQAVKLIPNPLIPIPLMRIAIGTDHRGFEIRAKVVELVRRLGHEAIDVGTFSPDAVDYPDIAAEVAHKVGHHEVDRGILVCGTGLGMCIAANKVPGVRAAPCHDDITAEMSRRHNDSNVLCLSADLLGERLIDRMIEIWLSTPFEGGRHARRVDKITALEHEAEGEGGKGKGEGAADAPSAESK